MIYHETEHGILYHGDCLDILPTLGVKADMVLTDPPYGITGIDWDSKINLKKLWELLFSASKENASFLIMAMQPFTTDLINSNRENFKFAWVWYKHGGSNMFNLGGYPLRVHEDAIMFCRSSKYVFNPQRVMRCDKSLKRDGVGSGRKISGIRKPLEHYGFASGSFDHELSTDGKKHPISIIDAPQQEVGRYKYKHPTKKPVSLFSYLLLTYSNNKDLILDPFAGSGTTAIACIRLGRKYILIEKEEKYCEIAKRRIENELEQLRIEF